MDHASIVDARIAMEAMGKHAKSVSRMIHQRAWLRSTYYVPYQFLLPDGPLCFRWTSEEAKEVDGYLEDMIDRALNDAMKVVRLPRKD